MKAIPLPLHAALALLLMPAPLAAQPASDPAPTEQVFVAPSGEVFRNSPGAPWPVADWFAAADIDGDKRLTLAEYQADADRYFATLDSDRSGRLEPAEIDRYEAEVLAGLPARVGPPPRGRARPDPDRPRGAGLYGLMDIRHPVKAADIDMNAHVTQAEYRAIMARRFERLDQVGRGAIRLAELPPTPAQEILAPKPSPHRN